MLTTIHGTIDRKIISDAVVHYLKGLLSFVSPTYLSDSKHKLFAEAGSLKNIVEKRYVGISEQIVDILASINKRAITILSSDYKNLANLEQELWLQGEKLDFEVGIRACVDAGLTREAVAGTGGHLGRSLAGDDDLIYVPEIGEFRLTQSVMKKKLIHAGRGGRREFLEILIEHTGCGRRAQMMANLDSHSDVTKNFEVVFQHLECIVKDRSTLEMIRKIWPSKMKKDGGAWAGIWVKKAQCQAYRGIEETELTIPILLYDKMDGNVWVGIDQDEVLMDPLVIKGGGYTKEVLGELAVNGKIWCLKNEMRNWGSILDNLTINKGQYTFIDLQHNWLEVKKKLIQICAEMWERIDQLESSLTKFVEHSGMSGARKSIRRRYIHQLFRMFAYLWVLDTELRGNMPGKHMEDHLASGESAVLGVKEHLPLGQGGLQVPTATEFFTGRSVLLHSTPGKEGKPIVILMKHDTSESDQDPLSGEETQRAMDDFAEVLKLWPYIVVGDLVPVVVVRNKKYMGISRLALSVVLAFGDIVQLAANAGSLPDIVPASNSRGEVVLVPATEILRVGIEADELLPKFRDLVTQVADNYSNDTVQLSLRTMNK